MSMTFFTPRLQFSSRDNKDVVWGPGKYMLESLSNIRVGKPAAGLNAKYALAFESPYSEALSVVKMYIALLDGYGGGAGVTAQLEIVDDVNGKPNQSSGRTVYGRSEMNMLRIGSPPVYNAVNDYTITNARPLTKGKVYHIVVSAESAAVGDFASIDCTQVRDRMYEPNLWLDRDKNFVSYTLDGVNWRNASKGEGTSGKIMLPMYEATTASGKKFGHYSHHSGATLNRSVTLNSTTPMRQRFDFTNLSRIAGIDKSDAFCSGFSINLAVIKQGSARFTVYHETTAGADRTVLVSGKINMLTKNDFSDDTLRRGTTTIMAGYWYRIILPQPIYISAVTCGNGRSLYIEITPEAGCELRACMHDSGVSSGFTRGASFVDGEGQMMNGSAWGNFNYNTKAFGAPNGRYQFRVCAHLFKETNATYYSGKYPKGTTFRTARPLRVPRSTTEPETPTEPEPDDGTIFGALLAKGLTLKTAPEIPVVVVPDPATYALTKAVQAPYYGTAIARVTDNKVALASNQKRIRSDYSRRQAFNADNSLYLMTTSDGYWRTYDGKTGAMVKQLPGLAGDAEPIWHPTDPNTLWYVPQNGFGMRMHTLNVQTDALTTVDLGPRLRAIWPTAATCWTKAEGAPSADGRYWCWQVENASFGILGVVVYDREADQILGHINTDVRPDHVSMAPSGQYATISWAFNPTLGTRAYTRNLTDPHPASASGQPWIMLHAQSEHSDLALLPNGQDAYVFLDYQSNSGEIAMVNLHTGVRTHLMNTYVNSTNTAYHISAKCYKTPGFAVVSTYGESLGSSPGVNLRNKAEMQWFHRKVFVVSLEANPKFWPLVFADSDYKKAWAENAYWAEPQATVNSDLTRILFNSTMNSESWQDVETYMLALPPGLFQASTPVTPTPDPKPTPNPDPAPGTPTEPVAPSNGWIMAASGWSTVTNETRTAATEAQSTDPAITSIYK